MLTVSREVPVFPHFVKIPFLFRFYDEVVFGNRSWSQIWNESKSVAKLLPKEVCSDDPQRGTAKYPPIQSPKSRSNSKESTCKETVWYTFFPCEFWFSISCEFNSHASFNPWVRIPYEDGSKKKWVTAIISGDPGDDRQDGLRLP